MKSATLKTPDTKGRKPVLVLQAAELALDGGAARVEVAEAARLARDQRVAPLGLDPAGGGLALTGGAAPLGGVALEVGTGERPAALLAGRSAVLAACSAFARTG